MTARPAERRRECRERDARVQCIERAERDARQTSARLSAARARGASGRGRPLSGLCARRCATHESRSRHGATRATMTTSSSTDSVLYGPARCRLRRHQPTTNTGRDTTSEQTAGDPCACDQLAADPHSRLGASWPKERERTSLRPAFLLKDIFRCCSGRPCTTVGALSPL